jgi:hypothetical protein
MVIMQRTIDVHVRAAAILPRLNLSECESGLLPDVVARMNYFHQIDLLKCLVDISMSKLNALQAARQSNAITPKAEISERGRWVALRNIATGCIHAVENVEESSTAMMPQLLQWKRPDDITEEDPCNAGYKFPKWIAMACDQKSGRIRITSQTKLTADNYAAAILHSEKVNTLWTLRHSPVRHSCMLRGWIAQENPDMFWVGGDLASLTRSFAADPRSNTGDDTWKNSAAWIISCQALREALDQRASPDDLWASGRLHILERAPRNMTGRWRIVFAPPVSQTCSGDCLMVVLQFVGPQRWAYTAIRQSLKLETPTYALNHIFNGQQDDSDAPPDPHLFWDLFSSSDNIDRMPPSLKDKLDDEQLAALKGISSTPDPVQVLTAFAGTGKSHVAKCLIWGYLRLRDKPDEVVVLLFRTKRLREEMISDLLIDVCEPDELLAVGALPRGPDVDRLLPDDVPPPETNWSCVFVWLLFHIRCLSC